MNKRKRKFAIKGVAIICAVSLFGIGISIATGLLRFDIIASSIDLPANYKKVEERIENTLSEGRSFVFFTSNWCGPCQTLSKLYKLSAQKYSDIKFYETDIEINRDFANSISTENAPSVIFIQDGKVIGSAEVGINEIEKTIDKYASL